jgi:hypothetical protein
MQRVLGSSLHLGCYQPHSMHCVDVMEMLFLQTLTGLLVGVALLMGPLKRAHVQR